jgi:hypothetical protein
LGHLEIEYRTPNFALRIKLSINSHFLPAEIPRACHIWQPRSVSAPTECELILNLICNLKVGVLYSIFRWPKFGYHRCVGKPDNITIFGTMIVRRMPNEKFWSFLAVFGQKPGSSSSLVPKISSSRAAVTRHLDNMPECFIPGVATQ